MLLSLQLHLPHQVHDFNPHISFQVFSWSVGSGNNYTKKDLSLKLCSRKSSESGKPETSEVDKSAVSNYAKIFNGPFVFVVVGFQLSRA